MYGSVACGTASVGNSDVDLAAIGVPSSWAHETGARLSKRFARLCRGVEIGSTSRDSYVGDSNEAYGNRVFLRHYCVPLAGPDAVRRPGGFRGDARPARGFNGDIGLRLAQWRTSADARRVARKTLFAAAGVVSVRDQTWTTDRDTAACRWAELYPGWTDQAAELLAWANGGRTASAHQLVQALAPDGIVAAVAARFAADIGLWP